MCGSKTRLTEQFEQNDCPLRVRDDLCDDFILRIIFVGVFRGGHGKTGELPPATALRCVVVVSRVELDYVTSCADAECTHHVRQ